MVLEISEIAKDDDILISSYENRHQLPTLYFLKHSAKRQISIIKIKFLLGTHFQ